MALRWAMLPVGAYTATGTNGTVAHGLPGPHRHALSCLERHGLSCSNTQTLSVQLERWSELVIFLADDESGLVLRFVDAPTHCHNMIALNTGILMSLPRVLRADPSPETPSGRISMCYSPGCDSSVHSHHRISIILFS